MKDLPLTFACVAHRTTPALDPCWACQLRSDLWDSSPIDVQLKFLSGTKIAHQPYTMACLPPPYHRFIAKPGSNTKIQFFQLELFGADHSQQWEVILHHRRLAERGLLNTTTTKSE